MGTKNNSNQLANKKKTSINDPSLHLPKVRPIYLRPSYIALGTIILVLAVFFIRVAIWEHNYLNRMEGSERHTTSITPVNEIEEDVDESEPTEQEITEYHVAPGKPRYFSIHSIGIHNARIVEIGLKTTGELSTPYNIYNVGWYTGSALPGSNGVSVLDGHGGFTNIGIFGNLPPRAGYNRGIVVGDEITIEMEATEGAKPAIYTYRVTDTATKNLGDEANNYMTTAFESPVPGQGSITIITCTGDWWAKSKTYSQRFFVRAVLES